MKRYRQEESIHVLEKGGGDGVLISGRIGVIDKAGLAVLASCTVVYFLPTWKSLIHSWVVSSDYSHGFAVVPISLYFVWIKRKELAFTPRRCDWRGVLLLVILIGLYTVSRIGRIHTLSSIFMVLYLMGIVIALFGFHVLKVLIFPLLFLFFMIPVPAQIYSALTLPLQLLVTNIAVSVGILSGIPIYSEGNIIYLPGLTLAVVEACSGVRSLLTIAAISTVYGHIALGRNFSRVILVLSSVPIAVSINVIRLLIISWAVTIWRKDLTQGLAHDGLGIAIYMIAILIVVIFGKVLGKWENRFA